MCVYKAIVMTNVIRLCHPADLRFVIEFDGKKFNGGLGIFIQDILHYIRQRSNITWDIRSKDDGIGEPIHGTNDRIYSGCIGLIQNNQSDILMQIVNYPLPAINLTQGAVVIDSQLQFLNAYDVPQRGQVVQIESMFQSLSPAIWMLSALIWIICTVCLLVRSHFRKVVLQMLRSRILIASADRNLAYQVATHMTRRGQINNPSGYVKKLIYFVLSFFSFIVIFYLCSMVKTELVVVPSPITMRSYSEMLEQGCGVFFFRSTDTHVFFESAPEDSDAKRLWDFTNSQFPPAVIIYDGNMERLRSIVAPMLEGKLSLVSESIWMEIFSTEFCRMSVDYRRVQTMASFMDLKAPKLFSKFPLVSQDKNAETFLKAFVASQYKSAPVIEILKSFRRAFECGVPNLIIKIASNSDFADALISLPRRKSDYEVFSNCIRNKVYIPELHIENVTIKHIANMACLLTFLLTMSGFLLIFEFTLKTMKRKKLIGP